MARNINQHSNRKTKIGRPTKRTLELMRSIAECVGKGMHLNEAANKHRIPYPTVERWARDAEFNDEIGHAQAVSLERLLDKLYGAEDPRCAQFLLERLHGTRFADPKIGLMVNIQNNTIVPGLGMSQDQLREERERLDRLQTVPGKPALLNPYLGSSDPAQLDAYIAQLQKIRAELPDVAPANCRGAPSNQ